jgi:hypothetical protein
MTLVVLSEKPRKSPICMAISTTAKMIPIRVTAKRERSWARLRQASSPAIPAPQCEGPVFTLRRELGDG